MTNKITWANTNIQLTDEMISDAEKFFSVKLPPLFIDTITYNDGGYPQPNRFKKNGYEEIFNNLISFNSDEYDNIYEIMDDISDRLIKNLVPFGEDPFGNLLCLDYRKENKISIVFWNHELSENSELAITNICQDFNQLLEILY